MRLESVATRKCVCLQSIKVYLPSKMVIVAENAWGDAGCVAAVADKVLT